MQASSLGLLAESGDGALLSRVFRSCQLRRCQLRLDGWPTIEPW
jgi:hypothetical protein